MQFGYSGYIEKDNTFWYVKQGKVQFNYTGAAEGTLQNTKAWWRVEQGRAVTNYTGVAKNEYGWWYFQNGKVNFGYTGVEKNAYGWWRIENGKVNFQFHGIAANQYGSWYLEDGKVQFGFSGRYQQGDVLYVITNGKVTGQQSYKDIPSLTTNVNVVSTYYGARLSWDKVERNGVAATQYEIYRKSSPNGTKQKLVTLGGNTTTYDFYCGWNADPTTDTYIYEVRPTIQAADGTLLGKPAEVEASADNQYVGGYYYLAPPDLVSVTVNNATVNVTFRKVPYATEYAILAGNYQSDGTPGTPTTLATVKAENSGAGSPEAAASGFYKGNQTATAPYAKAYDYITVQALSGAQKSSYDTGFRLNSKKLSGSNILFLGDSLVAGTPYNANLGYTISDRVAQQTGATAHNAAVGGAVLVSNYPNLPNNSIYHNQNLPISQGKVTGYLPLADYDVVVLDGGPNDWWMSVVMGEETSTNVAQFYGALYQHMELLRAAGQARVSAGKSPLKVVFLNLYKSPEGTQDNKLGLQYETYVKALKVTAEKYGADPTVDVSYWEPTCIATEHYDVQTVDNVHFTAYTYGQIGNELARYLLD